MVQEIDGVEFRMGESFDFGFLERFGRVFKVFDDQDSGNICFGSISLAICSLMSIPLANHVCYLIALL